MMNLRFILIFFVFVSYLSCDEDGAERYKVFRYNQINHITSLDPAFAKSQNSIWATHHLYDGLVRLDDDLNVRPAIAHSWDISEDGKVYTFFLRTDVRFHQDSCFQREDQRLVKAEDFKYSFDRLLDEKVNSPGSWLFSDKVDRDGFVVVDDTTFQIRLNKPFLPLLGILTMQYCSVVPQEAIDYYTDEFAYHPIGTGPFLFKRWVINQALFLNRNEDYFEDTESNLDGIKTSFIPDKKISFLELLNGNLDYVSGLESSFISELLSKEGELLPEKEDIIKFKKSSYLNTEYIGINYSQEPENSPLRIKSFRQALNLAIDRQLMLTSLRNNVGRPATGGIVPRGLPSFDDERVRGYHYDPDSARVLITGCQFESTPSISVYTNKDYLDLTTFIAKQWEQIGVDVDIEVLESSILRDGMRKSSIPMFRASWIADYPDAESFLCLFYSKYPAPPNYTRYANPDYDVLYERAIQEGDESKRYALYQQMDRMIVEDAPVIFLFYDETAQFYGGDISGISSNAINLLEVNTVVKK